MAPACSEVREVVLGRAAPPEAGSALSKAQGDFPKQARPRPGSKASESTFLLWPKGI